MSLQFVKTTIAAAVLGMSVLAMPAQAASVSEDMVVMMQSVGQVMNAENQADMLKGLDALKQASLDAEKAVPSKLKAGTPEYAGYQKGMQEFIAAVDSVRAKVEKGQLDAARQEVRSQLFSLRNKYHALYK